MLKHFYITMLIALLLFINNTNAAKHYESEQSYIDDMFACQLAIKGFDWSNSLWPKENKSIKPNFSEVINKELLKSRTLEVFQKEVLLKEIFNYDISNEMLQTDLNRMAMNTKNSKKLTQLFKLLDNNPEKIVNCISRPNLVINKLNKFYASNEVIHSVSKLSAQRELDAYKKDKSIKLDLANISTITYKIKDNNNSKPDFNKNVLFLTKTEFSKKLQFINESRDRLIVKPGYFTYLFLKKSSKQEIILEKLLWKKKSLSSWMKTKRIANIVIPKAYEFKLPKVLDNITNVKNTDYDLWRPYSYESRKNHTAIWTGSKMIVWGGFNGGKTLDTGIIYDPATDVFTRMTAIDPPSARENHTAVWTGMEMIIWGGKNSNSYKSDGKKYNPSTNLWTTISTSPLNARENHTALYTNGQMIIWAGNNLNNYTNTGAIYTINSDDWQLMSTAGAPTVRSHHSANYGVFLGPGGVGKLSRGTSAAEKMVVWGGYDGSQALNTGGLYDLSTDTWSVIDTTGAPIARFNHSTVIIQIPTGASSVITGIIYSGGENENGNIYSDRKVYFPNNNSWGSVSGSGLSARTGISTVAISATEVIFWGGCDLVQCFNNGEKLEVIWNTNTSSLNVNWSVLSNTSAATERKYHTGVWTGSQVIYYGGEGDNGSLKSLAARYVPNTGSWIPVDSPKNPPDGRVLHSAVLIGDEIMIWGGSDEFDNLITEGFRYNLVTDIWLATSSTDEPSTRRFYSFIWSGMDVIVWGGVDDNLNDFNSGAKYNVLNDSWVATSTSGVIDSRYSHSAVWTGLEMIVWGGVCCSDLIYNDGGIYHPNSNTWSALPDGGGNLPTRVGHYAYWTGNSMVIWSGFGYEDDGTPVLKYSAGVWSVMNLAGTPTILTGQVVQSIGADLFVWGGETQEIKSTKDFTNQGFKYSSSLNQWSSISVLDAPIARAYAQSVWTGKEVIVFGGDNVNGTLVSGARYDPSTDIWKTMTTESAPIKVVSSTNSIYPDSNNNHSMTWTGEEVILWGGIDSNGNVTNDMDFYFSTSFSENGTGNCSSDSDVIFCNGFEIP